MSIILRDSERCISGKLPIEQWDIYGNSRINKLIIQDIDTDILDLSVLPDHIVDIVIFNSRIKKLILPEELMECNVKGVQLEEIVVNKELTSLICDNNNLTHLHVPDSIEWLIAGNNRLTTITSDGPLWKAKYVDIRDNRIKDFTLKLNFDIEGFYIENNPGIKLRYLDWVWPIQVTEKYIPPVPPGDYISYLSASNTMQHYEAFKYRLFEKIKNKEEYIDLWRMARDIGLEISSEPILGQGNFRTP